MAIYFMRVVPDGPVKIGHSNDPWARVSQVQIGNPNEIALVALMDGGPDSEKELHRRFAHLWIRGEWFRPEADLLALLATIPKAVRPRGEEPADLAGRIIFAFGGISKMADATGWPTSTIHSAQANGFVGWRCERILRFAEQNNIELDPEVAASIREKAA